MPSPFVASLTCLSVAALACLAMSAGARILAPLATRKLIVGFLLAAAGAFTLEAVHSRSLLETNLAVAAAGLLGGALIGRHIPTVNVLAVALVLAAGADCGSFLFGPTHFAMKQAAGTGMAPLMAYLSISIPIHARLYSVIGLGDLWIFTACVASTRRLGWPERAAVLAPLLGILAAVAIALAVGPVPALPFLAGAVLIYAFFCRARRRGFGAG